MAKFHKFQHYYSIFLYGLLTFNWALTTDYIQTKRYLKQKLSYGKFPKPSKTMDDFSGNKIDIFWHLDRFTYHAN